MIGRSIHDFLPPDVSKERNGWFDEVLTLHHSLDFQVSRLERRYSNSLQSILNSKGEAEKVAIFVRDITQEHDAFEALIESERKYRLLVNTARIGIVVTLDWHLKSVGVAVMYFIIGIPSVTNTRRRNPDKRVK